VWVMFTCENKEVCQQTLNALERLEGKNLLVINGGKDDYASDTDGLMVPPNWDVIRFPEVMGMCQIMQILFKQHPNEEFYGIIPENCIIEATGWEDKLKQLSAGRMIVSANDGNDAPIAFTGVQYWSGDLVRKVGWWGQPDLHSSCNDWMWTKIAWDMVCWDRAMQVKVTYLPRKKSAMDDAIMANHAKDKETFEKWRDKDYHRIFRRLFFETDKWGGKTRFKKDESNGQQNQQTNSVT